MFYQLARQMNQDGKDLQQVWPIKNANIHVLKQKKISRDNRMNTDDSAICISDNRIICFIA